MSTNNLCFHGKMRKILGGYPLLSGAMCYRQVIEPAHDKTYNKTFDQRRLRSACASTQSDQCLH